MANGFIFCPHSNITIFTISIITTKILILILKLINIIIILNI